MSSTSKSTSAPGKTYFLKRFNEIVQSLPDTKPEAILSENLAFALQNAHHLRAKDIMKFRWTVDRIEKMPDTDPRKKQALDELFAGDRYKQSLQMLEGSYQKVLLIQRFLCEYYDVPFPDLAEIQNEMSDDIVQLMADSNNIVGPEIHHETRAYMPADQASTGARSVTFDERMEQ